MSVEIAWKQNILVTDFHLLKSLLVVLGFGSQVFVCGFSRQNINSVAQIRRGGPEPAFRNYQPFNSTILDLVYTYQHASVTAVVLDDTSMQ